MTDTDVSQAAALFGDPARARMLLALMGGYARPASELARLAHIAPQTASAHLAKLQRGGLITVQRRGRWRYYRLAGPEVARVIEALQNLCGSGGQVSEVHLDAQNGDSLKMCRTCYDHLAGYVAVSLADALTGQGYLELEEKLSPCSFGKGGSGIIRYRHSSAGQEAASTDQTLPRLDGTASSRGRRIRLSLARRATQPQVGGEARADESTLPDPERTRGFAKYIRRQAVTVNLR